MYRYALFLLACLASPCHAQYGSVPRWRVQQMIDREVEKGVAPVLASLRQQRSFVSVAVKEEGRPVDRFPERLKKLPGFENWLKDGAKDLVVKQPASAAEQLKEELARLREQINRLQAQAAWQPPPPRVCGRP